MAAAPPDGQEKVIAVAQHIFKSLANSKNIVDSMIRILSGFDNRFSNMTDLFPLATPNVASVVGSAIPHISSAPIYLPATWISGKS
jgi:exocyst complex protein 7